MAHIDPTTFLIPVNIAINKNAGKKLPGSEEKANLNPQCKFKN